MLLQIRINDAISQSPLFCDPANCIKKKLHTSVMKLHSVVRLFHKVSRSFQRCDNVALQLEWSGADQRFTHGLADTYKAINCV